LRSCDYYHTFSQPKLIYQEMTWWQTFQSNSTGIFLPNTAYMIASTDCWLLSVLNSPTFWWWSWRKAMHGKDEALRYIQEFIVTAPIPTASEGLVVEARDLTDSLTFEKQNRAGAAAAILDWLRYEFGLDKPGAALSQPHTLDADAFAAAVRKALPKSHKLSAADFARLRQEHAATVEPSRRAAAQALALERQLSDLVNAAYGLTAEEVALMWATAPPRMPFAMQ
jgi:hypothetical protein